MKHLFPLLLAAASLVGCAPDEATKSDEGNLNDGSGPNVKRSTIYVHGRTSGTPEGWKYWASEGPRPGVNAVAVAYDGHDCIANTNPKIVQAFDENCSGDDKWCYVVCHSAGCAQVGYAMDKFGKTESGGNRWNIYWTLAAGSAEGGSELADLGHWTGSECMTKDLRTSKMRASYNHDNTLGTWRYMYAGARSHSGAAVISGQDDGAVGYHSSGGVSKTGSFSNPSDWTGTTLEMGTTGTRRARLYAYHTVQLRDDEEKYDHYAASQDTGITWPVFLEAEAKAK